MLIRVSTGKEVGKESNGSNKMEDKFVSHTELVCITIVIAIAIIVTAWILVIQQRIKVIERLLADLAIDVMLYERLKELKLQEQRAKLEQKKKDRVGTWKK